MIGWWELPGPWQFTARVAEDLRSGRNVVLCLPDWLPEGLREAVQARLPPSAGWVWDTIDLAQEPLAAPADLIARRYLSDDQRARVRSARDLAVAEGFDFWLIWVDGVDSSRWPAWREFLVEFEAACRERPACERSLLCVTVRGLSALDPPSAEVCLSVRLWQGEVEPLDMFIYCWALVREKPWSELHRRLAASLLAAVSVWDPRVAERLAQQPLSTLLRPHPLLAEIARERGWEDGEASNYPVLWALGMAEKQEGRWRMHSALLALHDPAGGLRSRIWSAEVSAVLPFLEEFRRTVLERHRALLRLPHSTPDGRQITDCQDLELQHLAYQLARHPAVPESTRAQLRRLVNIRNRLAHLAVLEPAEIAYLAPD